MLLAGVLLSACVSNKEHFSKMREVFTTDIDEHGSKRFTYLLISRTQGLSTLGIAPRQGQLSANSRRNNNRFERVGANKEDIKKDFIERLDQFMQNNQYCRQGYMELDFTAVITEIQMTGECNESATPQDIKKWQTAG